MSCLGVVLAGVSASGPGSVAGGGEPGAQSSRGRGGCRGDPVTASALTPGWYATTEPDEFGHVLAGQAVGGAAAELAGRLDPAFLSEAGWDPVSRVLSLPAGHRLLGRTVCRVGGCTSTAHGTASGGVCWRCFTGLRGQGLTGPQIAAAPELPSSPDRPAGCASPGCQRMSPTPRSMLCAKHSRRFRRRPGRSLEQFLTHPGVRPLPALGPCGVAACTRTAEPEHGYCSTHYVRWRTAVVAKPDTDQRRWELATTAVSEGGQVSLRGCHRWWSSRCCSVSSNAFGEARR